MNEMVKCNCIGCDNTLCMHIAPHPHDPSVCDTICNGHPQARCIGVIAVEEKTNQYNNSCEYHGHNIETEVLDAWVYQKSKVIELRCIDICKQCGKGYGKIYSLFADKFVKEE